MNVFPAKKTLYFDRAKELMAFDDTKVGVKGLVDAEEFDRVKELKEFDDTKAGVKGLVDAGIVKIPRIFIRPADELAEELTISSVELQVPVINLSGCERDNRRKEIVDQVRLACEDWGFFQLVNHGIPTRVMESMIEGVRSFHEQDPQVKMQYYTRDLSRSVFFHTNVDFYQSRFACWRDTLTFYTYMHDKLDPDQVPTVCRDITFEYKNQVSKLGETVFELLSEALGLKHDYLKTLDIGSTPEVIICHYYPACPEPELTLGGNNHKDLGFITMLLQDHIGGLQFLHQNQWVHVPPLAGGLVVNIGDALQIISNDKFKSVRHRVLANHVGPRISVASFFLGAGNPPRTYGPIKDLISEESPPLYKEFQVPDYISNYVSIPVEQPGQLEAFKL